MTPEDLSLLRLVFMLPGMPATHYTYDVDALAPFVRSGYLRREEGHLTVTRRGEQLLKAQGLHVFGQEAKQGLTPKAMEHQSWLKRRMQHATTPRRMQ